MNVPFVQHAAVVHGRAAVGVAWLLERSVSRGDLEALPAAMRAEVVAAIEAVRLAGAAWSRRNVGAVSGADSGTSATRAGADGASSAHEPRGEVLGVTESAEILGVGVRRARDLAAGGLGEKVGGRWVLHRAAVEEERARRGVA